jgi:hypothetical protein
MRSNRWFFVVAIGAGIVAAESAAASQMVQLAQTQPAPILQRQRAPGVPMAPKADAFDRTTGEHSATPYRTPRDERASNGRDPDRDLPMPRGVPSIIAP